MNIILTYFLFSSAALTMFIAMYSLTVRKTGIAKSFFSLCICIAIYSIGYAMELSSTELEQMLTWNAVKYIGLPFIPAFWVILSLQYTSREYLIRPMLALAIFAEPVVTLIMRYTNNWHHLFYTSVNVITELFPVLYVEKGPWYLVHGVFMAFCVLFSFYLYLLQFKRSSGIIRNQCIIMSVASVLPWLTYFPNVLNLSLYAIDFGPFVGSISCTLFFIALFRYEFLDLKPLARDQLFKCTKDGLIVLDTHFRINDFNDVAADVIKNLQDNSISKNIQTVLEQKGLIEAILSGKEIPYKIEHNKIMKHYTLRTSEILERSGDAVGFLIAITDVTDYIFAMNCLEELASVDELTEVYNRGYFFRQSTQELEKAQRKSYGLSLIILDIDFFKNVNDQYGHQAGDTVLQRISKICRKSIRSIDILGRYGGEEFIIFLPNTTLEDAVSVAQRIKQEIEAAEIPYGDNVIKVIASFGVTGTMMVRDETLDTFLKNADDALYKAKFDGRNRIQVISLPLSEAG
jgi:diguanylate cyclase (GGDEF)-like protein